MKKQHNKQYLEQITITLYNNFYETHKELYQKDPIEYWNQAKKYKDTELRKYKYYEDGK